VGVDTTNTVTVSGTPTDPRTGAVMAPDVAAAAGATVVVDDGLLPSTGGRGLIPLWLIAAILALGGALVYTASRRTSSRGT
jgi:hypothetical protein